MRSSLLGPDGKPIKRLMTAAEAGAVAREVDQLAAKLLPILRSASYARPMAKALALTVLAAEVAIHDDATESDFSATCRTAWQRAEQLHKARTGVAR